MGPFARLSVSWEIFVSWEQGVRAETVWTDSVARQFVGAGLLQTASLVWGLRRAPRMVSAQ